MVNPKVLVYKTIYLSLAIQIITTLISLHGFFVKLDDKDNILKDVLAIEAIVQFVEAFFYVWVILALKQMENMTRRRYIDWSITTPIMLLSTIIFMEFKYNRENNKEPFTFKKFINDNKSDIIKIFVFNALMLLFGYLGETGVISKYIGIPIGFIFFYLSFRLIYNKYANKTENGKKLFMFIFIVWGLYGIAAMLNVFYKNISYNILDIVAKNFYGLYIYYKILQYRIV
mgnify:CR=1 FL=1|tara:strand:- start:270 stop:956 length:687 start_codon:yes stop_codon:yes gene_type:complete